MEHLLADKSWQFAERAALAVCCFSVCEAPPAVATGLNILLRFLTDYRTSSEHRRLFHLILKA